MEFDRDYLGLFVGIQQDSCSVGKAQCILTIIKFLKSLKTNYTHIEGDINLAIMSDDEGV